MSYQMSGNVASSVSLLLQEGLPLNTSVAGTLARGFGKNYTTSQITKLYFANYAVGTTATNVDVTSLTDPVTGAALTFTSVVDILVINNDTTNAVTVGGGSNPLIANALPALAGQAGGSCVHLTTAIAVSGSVKILKLIAAAGTPSVDVVIIGN